MGYRQLIRPNFNVQAWAGACLVQAQNVVGAGGGPYSATVAANNTKYRKKGGKLPRHSVAIVWFDHWGTYQDYRNGEWRHENWGHVVVWSPWVFDGAGGFYSSPRNGYGGEWFRTIADVEREFNSKYRFWSQDINGVRVCKPSILPAAKPKPKPKPVPKPITSEEDTTVFIRKNDQSTVYSYDPTSGTKRALSKLDWNVIKRAYAAGRRELPLVNLTAAEAKFYGI